MNKKIILIGIISIVSFSVFFGIFFTLHKIPESSPRSDSRSGSDTSYYFIAIHNEPHHGKSDSEEKILQSYHTLTQMVEKADEYNIKLTLMFTAQWVSVLEKDPQKIAQIKKWAANGHEIAAHHHSIYHGNWDGYTDVSKEEAIAQRKEQGFTPEPYIGTLDAFITTLQKINPDIRSGCLNDEQDKNDLPDAIIYDTCSNFKNFGTPGEVSNDIDAQKGDNVYVSVGTWKNIERKWLAHANISTKEKEANAETVFKNLDSLHVYGVITHSVDTQAEHYYTYLEFLHQHDQNGEKSKTVSNIIEERILPEEQLTFEQLEKKYPPKTHSKSIGGKCGDNECDAMEQNNDNLCPQDCMDSETEIKAVNNKCGDGICDSLEKKNIKLCPQDCK